MKAAVVSRAGASAQVEELPVPEPGPGQVLLRVETCGLCHTDIHAMNGDWPVAATFPLIPGHEAVGIVEGHGAGVTEPRVGQRVAVPWLGRACGRCRYCIDGRENLCVNQANTGFSVPGGYAEYLVADARFVVSVPDGVHPVDAAPLTCAGVTTYAAVKNARVRPDETVAIFGVGGLGHLAVQYARLVGAKVIAVDVTDDKLALAEDLGADHVVNASTDDPAAAIAELGGADVAIVLAVEPEVTRQAFDALNRGGRLVLVALPAAGEYTLPVFQTVLRGISIIGSIVGTRQDLAEVFDLHAAGRTRVIAEERDLEDVNEAVEEVLTGRVPARLVFAYHTADLLPRPASRTTG